MVPSIPVRPPGSESIVSICHGEDASTHRYLISGETQRITRSAETLMAGLDDFEDAVILITHLPQHANRFPAVFGDFFKLLLAQAPGPIEKMMGNNHLAHVCQITRLQNLQLLLSAQAQNVRYRVGQKAHHTRVAHRSIQRFCRENDVFRVVHKLIHFLFILVTQLLGNLFPIIQGFLEPQDLVQIQSVFLAPDGHRVHLVQLDSGLGVSQLDLIVIRIRLQGLAQMLLSLQDVIALEKQETDFFHQIDIIRISIQPLGAVRDLFHKSRILGLCK